MKTLHDVKRAIKIGAIVLSVVIVSAYVYFETKDIIKGPVITIETPEDGALLDDSLVEVRGKAERISHIEMNGRMIHVDEDGIFNERVLLSYGYNTIHVSVKDRLGREKTEMLELIYK